MNAVALVSVLCSDRVGLVAAIAGHLFEEGVNLRDASFATLGSGAEFLAVCDLPDELSIEELESGLSHLAELEGAQVRVSRFAFDVNPAVTSRVTHRITVSGGDQLGLVARLSEVFGQNEANIVRLEARKLPESEGGLYVTRFAVAIPAHRVDPCLAAVKNTAGSLNLSSEVEESGL
jgi:glycine cleavage system transcriptional repressor